VDSCWATRLVRRTAVGGGGGMRDVSGKQGD
jgi:hypothetical protein